MDQLKQMVTEHILDMSKNWQEDIETYDENKAEKNSNY